MDWDWDANAGELQALLLLAHELLSENKLLTWTQAINRVMERGEDYLAWYENAPKGGGSFGAETIPAGEPPEGPRGNGEKNEITLCELPEKPTLKKHEIHENKQLVIEYIQNEWCVRLKQ